MINRRQFIGALSVLAGWFAGCAAPTPRFDDAPLARVTPIAQPITPSRAAFMQRAIEQRDLAVRAGDQSYGAIIVQNERIVGLGPSRVIVQRDATAHAEMEAIRDACRRLGTNDLSGCEMYATARPCRMCEAASYWANIATIYVGPEITDLGAPRYSNC